MNSYNFYKKELDKILNSKSDFLEKEKSFFAFLDIVIFDAILLLSNIYFLLKDSKSYDFIQKKIILKDHSKLIVFGPEIFDVESNESNKNLKDFYTFLSKKNKKLFNSYLKLVKLHDKEFILKILFYFDLDFPMIVEYAEKNKKDPITWLKSEILIVKNKLLKARIDLNKI
jgi:hypothetical protein